MTIIHPPLIIIVSGIVVLLLKEKEKKVNCFRPAVDTCLSVSFRCVCLSVCVCVCIPASLQYGKYEGAIAHNNTARQWCVGGLLNSLLMACSLDRFCLLLGGREGERMHHRFMMRDDDKRCV